MSQLFTSGGQSIGASASTSVLPMNTQDWAPLGWTGWISLQSKGLSTVFSKPQLKSIILWHTAFFIVQLSHPYMTTGKTRALTAAAKSLQSCLTLCNPIDGSPPDSPVPGILQARTMQWVVISFFNAWKWKVKEKLLSRVRLLATPRTAATRLLRPCDFPGKSTGVGCHCLLQSSC